MGKGKRRAKESPKDSFYAVLDVETPESDHVDAGVLASVLSAEFTLIDPSLVHAILLDYDPETLSQHIDDIREQLGMLEASSVPDSNDMEQLATPTVSPSSESGRSPLHSVFATSNGGTAISSNPSIFSDNEDDGEPRTEEELLATFFPGLPKRCIDEAFASEPSLEAAIDHLLSVELIRGVQRTGKWEGGADETDEPQQDWSTSRSRRGSASASSSSKPSRPSRTKAKKQKAKTMPLVDTMQRRPIVSRAASASSSTASGSRTPGAPSADVWSAFASLAAFLSEVVPRAGTQYFISYLHSPDYMCAYEAVQAAISALAASSSAVPNQEAVSILEEMYGTSVDDEDDSNLSVCVRATAGDVVAVMDLMDLLTDLTWWPDFESARENESDPFDTLVKLQSALPAKPSVLVAQAQPETQTTRAVNSNRLSRPTSQEPKKRERVAPGSKPAPSAVAYPSAHGAALPGSERWSVPRGTNLTKQQIHNTPWQEVAPTQRRAARGAHPLAASIPAYARGMLPQNKTAGALARAQRAEDAGLTADDCYNRGEMEWQRRAEAIREAGRHFKSSGRKDTAAMVASHYAARAREAMDSAREWELRGARMVIDRQLNSSSGHVVDLHYATVEQAVTLALETADNWWRNAQRTRENGNMAAPQPLIIVVGKGRHSVSNVGVLGPAVARALVDGGWRIERCEGYIAVKAR